MSEPITGEVIISAAEAGIPESIAATAQLTPIEDVVLNVLRERHPDIEFFSLIPYNQLDLIDGFVLVRRISGNGYWSGRSHLLDSGQFLIQVYTRDPDGDWKGAMISDGIRASLEAAGTEHKYYPGIGSIVRLRCIEEPVRKTDWITATGPVQFADLPTGFTRYESRFRITVRPPLWG